MKSAWQPLIYRLTALGYFQTYRTFGEGNLRVWDWDFTAELLTGDAQKVWRFFLGRGRLSRTEAARILGKPSVAALLSCGICREAKSGLSLGKAALISYHGHPYFVEISPEPRSMLTEDTKAVMSTIPGPDFKSCLSLYSGGGVECLGLIQDPERSVTFACPEADPKFLRANWELNGCRSSLRMATGLKLPTGRTFDLALARIPCWALPEKFGREMFCPGGAEGLKEIAKCFKVVAPRLLEDGVFGFSCLLYGEEKVGSVWPKLEALADEAGLKLTALCSSRQSLEPGIPLFGHLLSFLQYRTKAGTRDILEPLINHFGEHRMSHVHFLRATAVVSGEGKHSLLDLSDRYYGNWSI